MPAEPVSSRLWSFGLVLPKSQGLSRMCSFVFYTSLALQTLNVSILSLKGTAEEAHRTWLVVVSFIIQVPQVLVTILGSFYLLRYLNFATLKNSWYLYLSTILCFAGVYYLLYLVMDTAFESNDPRIFDGRPISLFVTMLYLSVQTQTLTGLGDVSSVGFLPEMCSTVQMFVGLLYSVFIISHTQGLFAHTEQLEQIETPPLTTTRRAWECVTKNFVVRNVRIFVRRFLLVVSLVIYFSNLALLQYIEPRVFHKSEYTIGVVVMEITFQLLQLSSVLFTSWKFVKHIEQIQLPFLLQSYCAVCITFASIYNLFFAFSPIGDRAFSLPSFMEGETPYYAVVAELFYFSVCTMTSTGFGDVYPRKWFTRVLVSCQMLLTILFTVVILGRGVSYLAEQRARLHHTFRAQEETRSRWHNGRDYDESVEMGVGADRGVWRGGGGGSGGYSDVHRGWERGGRRAEA